MEETEDRINNKIIEIETYLEELEFILPSDFEEYKNNFKFRLMGERSFEKIIGAVIDLTFFIIKEKNLPIPQEDKQTFEILANANIISQELAKRLSDAKGMRNVIAHEYGKINDELVFYSLTEELIKDVQDFISSINKLLKK